MVLGVKAVELSILQLQETTKYSRKIFNLPTKTLQFESNQFKHSPINHAHFLYVDHTWIEFSRHNIEGTGQEY